MSAPSLSSETAQGWLYHLAVPVLVVVTFFAAHIIDTPIDAEALQELITWLIGGDAGLKVARQTRKGIEGRKLSAPEPATA